MLEQRWTLQRLVLISSTAGATMLALILLAILGILISGDTRLDRLSALNALLSAAIALTVFLVLIGTVAVLRHPQAAGSMPDNSARLTIIRCLGNAASACTTASLVAVLLELAGLWKRMVPHPNPLMEQGAPIWMWWMLLAISLLLWLYPRRRASGIPDFKAVIRSISGITLAALTVASSAALLHVHRFDPVPSKYYGIPGFVVGREFPNEYGTYYGATGAAAATILGLFALIAIFLKASSYQNSTIEKQATGG
jgi:hypothetical protein